MAHLKIYANRLDFLTNRQVRAIFPFYENGCLKCANCKGAHIKEHRKNGTKVVFIGDGISDICGLPESDYVFAKDALKLYCDENNIHYYSFNDFSDVLEKFIQIENGAS